MTLSIAVSVLALMQLLFAVVAAAARSAAKKAFAGGTLEHYAEQNNCVYIPVGAELATELSKEWSKPLQIRLDTHPRERLAQLIVRKQGQPDG
jgi:hypothetical protein